MNKVLTVLLVGLVFCFVAGPTVAQAEEINPAVTEFSLTEDYLRPLVIPAVVKLEPVMLQSVNIPEVKKGNVDIAPFVMVATALIFAFGYASMDR